MKSPIIVAALLTLGACAPTESVDDVGPTLPVDGADQCKAASYRQYVGRNRSELPAKPANDIWRVTCTHCPVTMDYLPNRLNIVFDQSTGVIQELKCG